MTLSASKNTVWIPPNNPTLSRPSWRLSPIAHNALSATTRRRYLSPPRYSPATITAPQGRAQALNK